MKQFEVIPNEDDADKNGANKSGGASAAHRVAKNTDAASETTKTLQETPAQPQFIDDETNLATTNSTARTGPAGAQSTTTNLAAQTISANPKAMSAAANKANDSNSDGREKNRSNKIAKEKESKPVPIPKGLSEEGSFITKPLPAEFLSDFTEHIRNEENQAQVVPQAQGGTPAIGKQPTQSSTNQAPATMATGKQPNQGAASTAKKYPELRYPPMIPLTPPKPVEATIAGGQKKSFFLGLHEFKLNLDQGGTAMNVWNGPRKIEKQVIQRGKINGDGTFLPDSGLGYERYLPNNDHKAYGTGFLVQFIQDFSAYLYNNYPQCGKVQVGNLSAKGGGLLRFNSCEKNGKCAHVGHQNGLEVDIDYFSKAECNWAIVDLLAQVKIDDQTPIVDGVLMHPSFIRSATNWIKQKRNKERQTLTAADYETIRLMYQDYGHDDHMHIRLRCSPLHVGCWQDKTLLRELTRVGGR